jgi:AcrR family transcriptional regulator
MTADPERPHQHGDPGADQRTAPAAPRSNVRGPATRTLRKVMSGTIELIERHSYQSVTVDAIVRASGVSKSTIYRHWPSRESLVLEALTHRTNVATNTPDTGDAFADLHTYIAKLAAYLNFGAGASTVANVVRDALNDDDFGDLLRATMVHNRRRTFATIIRLGQTRKQIPPDIDVEIVVDALYGAIHHRVLVTREPLDKAFVDGLAALAARSLSQPGGSPSPPLRS